MRGRPELRDVAARPSLLLVAPASNQTDLPRRNRLDQCASPGSASRYLRCLARSEVIAFNGCDRDERPLGTSGRCIEANDCRSQDADNRVGQRWKRASRSIRLMSRPPHPVAIFPEGNPKDPVISSGESGRALSVPESLSSDLLSRSFAGKVIRDTALKLGRGRAQRERGNAVSPCFAVVEF